MNEYSIWKTIKKGIRFFVIVGLPFLISAFIKEMPVIANLTIGTILLMIANYLKQKVGITFRGLL